MKDKQHLIEEIAQGEWKMFAEVNEAPNNVPQKQGQPSCRDFPQEVRIHRSSKLMPWSTDTLESYLNDIITAATAGRNLMRYKICQNGQYHSL